MYLYSTTRAIAAQGAKDYTRALSESISAKTLFYQAMLHANRYELWMCSGAL